MQQPLVAVSELPLAQSPYPRRYDEIGEWASLHEQLRVDASRRWAHGVALLCLAMDEWTVTHCGIHGGNTISYIYGCPRTPVDVDVFLRYNSAEKSLQQLRAETAERLRRVLTKHMPEVVSDFPERRAELRNFIKIDLIHDTAYTPMPVGRWQLTPDRHIMAIDRITNIIRKLYTIFRPIRTTKKRASDLFDLAFLLKNIDPEDVAADIYQSSRKLIRQADHDEFPVALRHHADTDFRKSLESEYQVLLTRHSQENKPMPSFLEAWSMLKVILQIVIDNK